ncbi:MAG: hypothetical protein NWE81_00940 [Candidatus Bathyarchaeota archaeon]|nr:hypothetical protein [Candidatus Bathyarchaeota archaeon]
MSEESVGFTIMEKFFALLIIIIGVVVAFNVATTPGLNGIQPISFVAGGLVLVVLGAVMILAKTQ